MQSQMADFTLGVPTWQTGQNILWFWPIRSVMWKYDVNHKTGRT